MKVLIVDDNPAVCSALELLFEVNGIASIIARGPAAALEHVAKDDIGAVVQDMNFTRDTTSGAEGAELMAEIRKLDPDVPIVLMTAFTSLEMAVKCVKEGASDYIAKPWDDTKLVTTIKNLLRLRALADQSRQMSSKASIARRELASKWDLRGIVYASSEMHEVVSLAVRVAPSDAAVLITGPNGSGKEKLAEIVQANSRRADKPFVKVNAGGFPDNLLEAELFGAEAGAFTGATKGRAGRFEEANGGTLFLDEIGNLSATGQMKLLRVLQTGEYQRLGSNTTRKADVRLLSATNADLGDMIAKGTFRQDLFFRLNVIELVIPPLRDRADDALLLAEHFLKGATLDPSARAAILEHDWPGNVRELENRIQRATLVKKSDAVAAGDLGIVRTATPPAPAAPLDAHDRAERAQVERAIADAGGVISRAAASLGLSRQAFYRKMDRLGILVERKIAH